jgi:hypothetical protein
MNALNSRIYRRDIERSLNRASRAASAKHEKGSGKKHARAEHFEFPKHAQRFDPNAGPGRMDPDMKIA